jgi:hypothetical protein
MRYEFRWNEWNVEHLEEHGVSALDAEEVVNTASRPYPRKVESGKFLVRGRTGAGEYLQVVFIEDPTDTL